MPVKVVCKRCGYVLAAVEGEWVEVWRLLERAARLYGDKCPRCLKRLSLADPSVAAAPLKKR